MTYGENFASIRGGSCRIASWAALLGLLAGGCGHEVRTLGEAEPAVEESAISVFCAAEAEKSLACEADDGDLDEAELRCLVDERCREMVVRPEILALVRPCELEAECAAGMAEDVDCIQTALAAVGTTPVHQAYAEACALRFHACEGAFASEYCGLGHVRDEVVRSFSPCLGMSCESVDDCVHNTLATHYEACEG